MAGRASVELHTLIFFRSRQMVADARVTKVRPPAGAGSPHTRSSRWRPCVRMRKAFPAPAQTFTLVCALACPAATLLLVAA